MKSIAFIIKAICFLLFSFLFSCDNKLDIEPRQSISSTVALSNDQGVKTALSGAYDLLSINDVWGGRQFLSELYADVGDLVWTGSFTEAGDVFTKQILVQNIITEQVWTQGYKAINLCNAVIEATGAVNEADRAQVDAEARFIRAAVYFELVNIFAKTWVDGDPANNVGVPLVTTSTQSIKGLEVPRATVAAVYAQMIADLEFAKNNLPEENGAGASTYAASVLLSRIYLMQADYTAALAEAGRVIASGLFALQSDYNTVFNQSGNTPEDIFTLEVTSQDGDNDFIVFYAGTNAGGRGDITITDSHAARYEANDQRGMFFYLDDIGVRRTGKWQDNASQDGNVNLMRLSEMYLTRAECRFRDGDAQGAADDVNEIRMRAAASPFDATSLTLDNILEERYLELCFEGHIYRDIKRTQRNFGIIPFNADQMVFPIPQREMDVNSLLVQNAGYF